VEAALPSSPLLSRRILIVDDQASVRDVLGRVLADAGASVREAEDGTSALQAVRVEIPELILLDLAMPIMDGWEVIAALRGSAGTASIPVILETSSDDLASFLRAQRAGAAAFISKPFRLNDVVETCRRVLEGDRPLSGKVSPASQASGVRLRDPQGELLSEGFLLEIEDSGAHVDLERPLPPQLRANLFLDGFEGSRAARIEWVRPSGNRYHHGLSFTAEWRNSSTPERDSGAS
jgi:CheY-like chemotaxis protein